MNLDFFLIALIAALVAAAPAIAWALMERSRANRAEARAWDLQDAAARVRVMEEQSAKNSAFLQAEAAATIAASSAEPARSRWSYVAAAILSGKAAAASASIAMLSGPPDTARA